MSSYFSSRSTDGLPRQTWTLPVDTDDLAALQALDRQIEAKLAPIETLSGSLLELLGNPALEHDRSMEWVATYEYGLLPMVLSGFFSTNDFRRYADAFLEVADHLDRGDKGSAFGALMSARGTWIRD